MRGFNIGSLCFFITSTVFTIPFFGFIYTSQIVFSFVFDAFALLNITFLTLSPVKRANFVSVRLYSVYLPVLVLFVLQTAAMIIFLHDLDEINQRLDNIYPVDEESLLNKEYFVMVSLLLFFIAPLFMAVSYVAYALEIRK